LVKALRWSSLLAFLSLPVIFYLGRPQLRCPLSLPPEASCFILYPTQAPWLNGVFYTVSAIAVALLVLGAMVSRRPWRGLALTGAHPISQAR
jgi:hypothetical protein